MYSSGHGFPPGKRASQIRQPLVSIKTWVPLLHLGILPCRSLLQFIDITDVTRGKQPADSDFFRDDNCVCSFFFCKHSLWWDGLGCNPGAPPYESVVGFHLSEDSNMDLTLLWHFEMIYQSGVCNQFKFEFCVASHISNIKKHSLVLSLHSCY